MAETLEELQEQLKTYQEIIPTVTGTSQQSLLGAIEATQGKIAELQPPEPVLDPTPDLQQQQAGTPLPPPDPQTQPRHFKEQIPQMTPDGRIALNLVPKMPVPSATQQAQAPVIPEDDSIKEVSLSTVPDQQQPQQFAGMAPQMLTTTQTSIRPGVKISDELKQAIGETPAALSELGNVETKLGELESERGNLLQEYQNKLIDFKLEEDKRIADHKALIEDKLTKYDAEAEEIAKEKIDSKKWWKNASTGQRIGLILASALGAIGQGMTGGQTNLAVSSINAAIDKDIKDQLANLNNRKEANKNYMKRIRNISNDFNTDQARRYAAMDLNIKPIIKKLDGLEKTAQNSVQRANIAQLKQGFINTQLQLRAKIEQAEQPQISKTILSKPTGGAKTAKEIREQTRFEQEQRNLTVPGFKGKAFNAKKADEVRNAIDRYNIMEDTIKKLKSLSKTKLKDRAVADSIVKGLIGNLRVDLTGPGALSEGDMKLLNRLLPNPTDLFQMNNMARLETIAENLKRNVVQFAKGQGLKATSGAFATESAGRKYAK